jgi:hypothetical protein
VTVTSEAKAPAAEAPPPLARRYEAAEAMAASVAASDPLRAVQALPGVAANDELNAGFAARGSGFGAVGLHIDGVRLEAPFHTRPQRRPARLGLACAGRRPRALRRPGVERSLPASLRLRVEAYHQRESRLVFNRELDWRLEEGSSSATASARRPTADGTCAPRDASPGGE